VIADNDREEQQTLKGSTLLTNAVIFHTTLKITGTRVHDRPRSGWSGQCRVALDAKTCRHTTVGVSLDMSCGDAVGS
jgi:hypothetical protein